MKLNYSSVQVAAALFLAFCTPPSAFAQTPVTAYLTETIPSTPSAPVVHSGYLPANSIVYSTHIMRSNHTYTSNWGLSFPSATASTTVITGFTAGGFNYNRLSSSLDSPFTKISFQRQDNPAYSGNRFSGFFVYSSVVDNGGLGVYNVRDNGDLRIFMDSSPVSTMEDLLNNFSLSYGADNLFSNLGTGNAGSQGASLAESGNNIERVDMIYQPGLAAESTTDLSGIGILINERGGNDQFKVAAITGVDANGDVTALGPVITIIASTWGTPSGPAVSTIVYMGEEGIGTIRPKELVGMSNVTQPPLQTQNVAGLYISLADLQIAVNQTIYGFALFPGDITGGTDGSNYLTLASSPLNTPDAGTGGLDLMSGNMIVVREDIQLPVTLTSFSAQQVEQMVRLNWSTSSEVDFEGFYVEHSTDGKRWTSKEFVRGASGASKPQHYSTYIKENPAGLNYYRLKLVDTDNSVAYSQVVSLRLAGLVASVFPNPASNKLYLTTASSESGAIRTVKVLNINGQAVKQFDLAREPLSGGLSIHHLTEGIYLLELAYDNGRREIRRFVVGR